jgi:aspartate/tyrosine/aromatic aminotransferase
MSIISKSLEGKILKNDVLALSQEAKKAKQLDNSVVNATIGSLFDDNGIFYTFKNVDNLIKSLSNEDFYSYSPNNGNKDFHDAVTNWVLGNYYDDVINNLSVESIPTPGGTGAVSNALFNSLDAGETVLLPDIYWGPYKNMCEASNLIRFIQR